MNTSNWSNKESRFSRAIQGRPMQFTVANVICTFNSSSGGPPRTVSLIAQAGIGLWRSELFTTDYTESNSDRLLVGEFPGHVNLMCRNAQTPFGGAVRALGMLRDMRTQLVKGSRPDVVHVHGLWSPLLAAYARVARGAEIPYVVAPHGMLEPWSLTIRGVRKQLALRTYQGYILANAAAIHTTSEAEASHVRALGLTDAPIFVVPNAVDEPLESPPRAANSATERRVLLFLSRIHEKKGLVMLLEAWNTVRPAQWELRIVGHGEPAYVEHLKRKVASEAIPGVQFHAHVDGRQRELMFASATAFVLPTYSENFGNAVAEAMIRGLPVITTTGTPWSVIAERGMGWYVEPRVEPLRQALQQLTQTDPERLTNMGHLAQEYARNNLVISAIRPRLLDMYTSILKRG